MKPASDSTIAVLTPDRARMWPGTDGGYRSFNAEFTVPIAVIPHVFSDVGCQVRLTDDEGRVFNMIIVDAHIAPPGDHAVVRVVSNGAPVAEND